MLTLISDSLVENLLRKMLAVDPSERYNAENIAQHPFLTGKSVENIPMSSIEVMKAFRNQENFLNVILAFTLAIKGN